MCWVVSCSVKGTSDERAFGKLGSVAKQKRVMTQQSMKGEVDNGEPVP